MEQDFSVASEIIVQQGILPPSFMHSLQGSDQFNPVKVALNQLLRLHYQKYCTILTM